MTYLLWICLMFYDLSYVLCLICLCISSHILYLMSYDLSYVLYLLCVSFHILYLMSYILCPMSYMSYVYLPTMICLSCLMTYILCLMSCVSCLVITSCVSCARGVDLWFACIGWLDLHAYRWICTCGVRTVAPTAGGRGCSVVILLF